MLQAVFILRGDNVLITYTQIENKTILATYYETDNGIHYFRNVTGVFGVREKKIQSGDITLEVMKEKEQKDYLEDYIPRTTV